ncbi:MAG: hypothetical protein R2864_03805 [Syntrophotaleaceae bacterium]
MGTLKDAVRSVQGQSWTEWELVIVDNALNGRFGELAEIKWPEIPEFGS